MKTLYCKGCGTKVAKISNGSFLMKGMVCFCKKCEEKKALSDWADKTRPQNSVPDFMSDFFNKHSK